jgi:hypothetical protein
VREDGRSRNGFSGGNERDVHWARNGLAVLQPVRNQTQR